mgnify:CR=1 FL=1
MRSFPNRYRQWFFRTLLYSALIIFIFDFNFYRYGIDIRLGKIMHGIVANLEQEASQNLDQWRASL